MKHGNRPGRLVILLLLFPTVVFGQKNQWIIDHHDFFHGFEAMDADSLVHMVVEIPAGSNEKWEVSKETGHLEWEIRQDTFRVVPYLPYPANYGMIPGTFLHLEDGGDNDPLDIFLLGPVKKRGEVTKGRVVGVIKTLDGGNKMINLLLLTPKAGFMPYTRWRICRHYFPAHWIS